MNMCQLLHWHNLEKLEKHDQEWEHIEAEE